jgi:two-component system chemotaxis response regulator CheB
LNGLGALSEIMKNFPTPVVMLSAYTAKGKKETIEALELGAVDFIAKPSGSISLRLGELKEEIISKVKLASRARVKKPKKPLPSAPAKPPKQLEQAPTERLVVIGASTGGPQAILEILSRLSPDLPACFLIVQHMPRGFTSSFANRLNSKSALQVKEASPGDALHQGVAYVAPGDYHLIVKDASLNLVKGLKLHGVRPAIDFTMESAALKYGRRTIGVLLTGMGIDGAAGMKAIKEKGGSTIVQDEETSLVFGMPRAAIKLGCIDEVLPLERIPEKIARILGVS